MRLFAKTKTDHGPAPSPEPESPDQDVPAYAPPDLMSSGPLLSRTQAAELLNVSATTVWRLVRDGSPPAYRVGHQIRIGQADLERYVTSLPPEEDE